MELEFLIQYTVTILIGSRDQLACTLLTDPVSRKQTVCNCDEDFVSNSAVNDHIFKGH